MHLQGHHSSTEPSRGPAHLLGGRIPAARQLLLPLRHSMLSSLCPLLRRLQLFLPGLQPCLQGLRLLQSAGRDKKRI